VIIGLFANFDKERYIIYVNRIGHRREIYEE